MRERDRRSRNPGDRKSRPEPSRPPQTEMPWRVPVAANDIPETGRHVDLVADPSTREAVARVAGVVAVERLEASFNLVPVAGEGVQVTGTVSGTVVQTCVVTLDPMTSAIEEAVDLTFMPPGGELSPKLAAGLSADDYADPPEMFQDGALDLGHIAIEFLMLGIDPYPRKPGATFEPPQDRPDAAEHPFAALAALKKESGPKRG